MCRRRNQTCSLWEAQQAQLLSYQCIYSFIHIHIYIYIYIYAAVNFHACIHAYLDVTCLACRSHDCPSTSGGLWLRHFGVGHHRCESHSVSGKHLRCSCGLGVWQGPSTVSVEYHIEGWTIYHFWLLAIGKLPATRVIWFHANHTGSGARCSSSICSIALRRQFCWKSEIQDQWAVACRLQSKHQCLGTNQVPLVQQLPWNSIPKFTPGVTNVQEYVQNWSF